MTWYKKQWLWATLAALPYTAWEFGHWWLELEVYTPWAFGQGFAAGSLIFGFWNVGASVFSRSAIFPHGTASRDEPGMDAVSNKPPRVEIQEADAGTVDPDRARKAEERIKYYSEA